MRKQDKVLESAAFGKIFWKLIDCWIGLRNFFQCRKISDFR